LALALHVVFITVSSVPMIAVAFDRQSRLSPFNHQVNSLACDFVLGEHCEVLAKEF